MRSPSRPSMFWRLFAKWNVPVKAAYLNPGLLLPSPGTDDAVQAREALNQPSGAKWKPAFSDFIRVLFRIYPVSCILFICEVPAFCAFVQCCY